MFRLSGRFAFDGEQEHAGELACCLKRSKQAGSVAKVLKARKIPDESGLIIVVPCEFQRPLLPACSAAGEGQVPPHVPDRCRKRNV